VAGKGILVTGPTLAADHAAAATVAEIAQRARRIVYLSANGVAEETTGGVLASHAWLERLIEDSGLEWTFLRPTGFAANTLAWAEQIRTQGVV
jgi:uncharacterized protein YbjT (DUF2867 family)